MDSLHILQQIRQMTPAFLGAVRQAAAQAHNEAEFERQMNNAIEHVASQWRTQVQARGKARQRKARLTTTA